VKHYIDNATGNNSRKRRLDCIPVDRLSNFKFPCVLPLSFRTRPTDASSDDKSPEPSTETTSTAKPGSVPCVFLRYSNSNYLDLYSLISSISEQNQQSQIRKKFLRENFAQVPDDRKSQIYEIESLRLVANLELSLLSTNVPLPSMSVPDIPTFESDQT